MKEIIRAENAGFCFGVRQAIEKAEKAANSASEEGQEEISSKIKVDELEVEEVNV